MCKVKPRASVKEAREDVSKYRRMVYWSGVPIMLLVTINVIGAFWVGMTRPWTLGALCIPLLLIGWYAGLLFAVRDDETQSVMAGRIRGRTGTLIVGILIIGSCFGLTVYSVVKCDGPSPSPGSPPVSAIPADMCANDYVWLVVVTVDIGAWFALVVILIVFECCLECSVGSLALTEKKHIDLPTPRPPPPTPSAVGAYRFLPPNFLAQRM